MGFDESTIEEIVSMAERAGAPPSVACDLEAALLNVLFAHRKRMKRIDRHSEILAMLADCGYSVTLAARKLDMTREGVYKHIRPQSLSTENSIQVDAQAA